MPSAAQALDVAMHIRSEPEVGPVALAYEMISLLRSVRTPAARWARGRDRSPIWRGSESTLPRWLAPRRSTSSACLW